MSATPMPSRRSPLSEKDWQYLENMTGKRGASNQIVLVGVTILFVIMAIVKIYLAFWIAGHDGYNAQAFLAHFSAGTSIKETYSGTFIRAADSMTIGIFLLAMAFAQAAMWRIARRNRERSQRILNALQSGNSR